MAAGESRRRLQSHCRDTRDEQGGEEERDRVDDVRRAGSGELEQQTGENRADDPGRVLGRSEEGVGLGEIVVTFDEVRQPRIRSRLEEAGGDARDCGQRDDRGRAGDERQGTEDRAACEIGGHHQPLAREAVEERPESEPDHGDREEVGDEQRRDPAARVGQVVDLQREDGGRQVRAERRPCCRDEQQPELRRAREECQTADGALGHAQDRTSCVRRRLRPKRPCPLEI